MYESFLKSDHVRSVLRGTAQLLGAITVMRKICNHPDLICRPDKASVESFLRDGIVSAGKFVQSDPYDSSDQDDEEDGYDDEIGDDFDMDGRNSVVSRSGKMEVLAKILPIWKKNGHRVLIFCQWKKMLDIIQRFTELQGWKFGRLDGNTNVASRQRLVDTFNSDQTYFGLLCTTRTGGVGLNLTGADRIILYDREYLVPTLLTFLIVFDLISSSNFLFYIFLLGSDSGLEPAV
jgi:DNA excision repair protein ERCC-6